MIHCGDGIIDQDEDEECDDGAAIHRGCVGCRIQPAGTGMFLGERYGCALIMDENQGRQVSCWGANVFQRLGADQRIEQRLIPTPHSDNASLSAVVQIAGGARAVCAVVRGFRDEILCWGDRQYLSAGGNVPSYAPQPVSFEGLEMPSRVHQLAMSSNPDAGDTACAVVGDNRQVMCWGFDDAGQTGRGEAGSPDLYRVAPGWVMESGDLGPVAIANVDSLAMGSDYTLALRTNEEDRKDLIGWGLVPGIDAQRLAVELSGQWAPSPMFQGDVVQMTAGRDHFCVLTDADPGSYNKIWCFGDNRQYQLGSITQANTRASVGLGVSDLPTSVHAFASGTCAVGGVDGASNKLWCWGDHSHGQLGSQGGRQTTHLPQQIAVYEQNIDLMVAGTQAKFRCVDADGAINCWGRNDVDQTGNRYAGENAASMQALTLNPDEQPRGAEDSDDDALAHCLVARDLGLPSGIYWTKPQADAARYMAYCDNSLDADGGGWALAMELNVDAWNVQAPGPLLRYEDPFWTTTADGDIADTAVPQGDILQTRKTYSALRQPLRDLYLDLKVQDVTYGTGAGAETLQTLGTVPESWYVERGKAFNGLVNGGLPNRTLHELFAGDAQRLMPHAGARSAWLPANAQDSTALVPYTEGNVDVNRDFSPIMAINPEGTFSEDGSACWWTGFNRRHSTEGAPDIARVRFGVLTSPQMGDSCSNPHTNFVGVGMSHSDDSYSYYPPVGAFGSTPNNGTNRTALWSDARIWVR
jgi:alpha-tubulin suppressor-like RCC1 family protein